MDELAHLKTILKNSFAGIKRDMTDIKQSQDQQLMTVYQIKQELEKIKEDYASKDKLNVLKIKVGEINDNLKKLWDLENEIKKLENKTVTNSQFDVKVIEINAAMNKKIQEVNKAIENFKEKARQLVGKEQIKNLLAEINEEFNLVHKELSEIKNIKETITARELEKKASQINARIDLLAREILNTNKRLAQSPTNAQMQTVIAQINSEFDEIRKNFAEIGKLKKYLKFVDDEAVRKEQLDKSIAGLSNEISFLRKELGNIKGDMLKRNEFESYKDEVNNLKERLKTEFANEFVPKKEQKQLIKAEVKEIRAKLEEKQTKYRKTNFMGNFLMILTFIFLIASLWAYFAVEETLVDYFSLIAIATFVIGLILKIVVVAKRR